MKDKTIKKIFTALVLATTAFSVMAITENPVRAQKQATAKFPLPGGTELQRDVKYFSQSGNHFLIFAKDGNLVVATKTGGFVWGLNEQTPRYAQSARVFMTPQGLLGVLGTDGKLVWSTPTMYRANNASLDLTDNGVLRTVHPDGRTLWSSAKLPAQSNTQPPDVTPVRPKPNTGVAPTTPLSTTPLPTGNQFPDLREATKFPIPTGTTLKKDVKYVSPSGNHVLTFAKDGNLVVATKTGGFVWGLNQITPKYNQSARFDIKPDGSFGTYDAKGNPVWAPPFKRDPNSTLNLTPTGVLQMIAANGDILWASDGNLYQFPVLNEAVKFPIPVGTTLKKDFKYVSPSGNHSLTFAKDGNLVVTSEEGGFVWGLNGITPKYNQSERLDLRKDGSFGAYDAKGNALWAPTTKRDPNATLNLTFTGALQLIAANGDINWSSDGIVTPGIKVFQIKANLTPCNEPGWDQCVVMADPAIKIIATKAVSKSAINAVANIYTEMLNRLNPKYPKSKFDGFKVFMTNGEPWPVLSKLSTVGTMWKDQTGPMSGNVLRGGASNDFLWISEQMIAKKGVKTRVADGVPNNDLRTFDQVVHEFAHSIDMKFIPDQTINVFRSAGMTPVENFAAAVQFWFGVPARELPANEIATLKGIFISRPSFSPEGYQP